MLAQLLLALSCRVAQQAPPAGPAPASPAASDATADDRAAAELAAHLDSEGEFAWTPILAELRTHGLAGARQMVPRLGSDQGVLAVLSAQSLARMGPTAWPALVEGLHHANPATRAGCASVLAEFGPLVTYAVPQLVPLLQDPDEHAAGAAAMALLLIAPQALPEGLSREDLVERVAAGLTQDDASRRRDAIAGLGRLAATEPVARDALEGALRHADPFVRADAVETQLAIVHAAPSEAALDVVIDLLADEPPEPAPGDAEARQKRPPWPETTALVMSVQMCGSTPALAARLAKRVAQETGNKYRFERVFTELCILDGQVLGALVQETTACDEARFSAAWALGQHSRTHGLLRSMLSAPDETTRVAAVYGLGCCGPYAVDSLPDLEPLLRDESAWVRETLAKTLGHIAVEIPNRRALPALDEHNLRTLAAVPWLLKLAHDEGAPAAEKEAFDALQTLGAARVVPVLVERMASPDAEWRSLAVQIAGEIGYADPALREPLEAASRGADPVLRIAALSSIAQLWREPAVIALLEREAVDADTRGRVRSELSWLQQTDSAELEAAVVAALGRIPEP